MSEPVKRNEDETAMGGQRFNFDLNTNYKLTSAPLNGRNYLPWSRAARVSLKGKGRLGYIDGTEKRPEKVSMEQKEWDMCDGQVMSWIFHSMEPNLSEIFTYCDSSFELWKEIQDHYSDQNNFSSIFDIKKDIAQANQGTKSVKELSNYLKAKFEELKTYRPPTTDPKILQERLEQDQVYAFLTALDSSYDAVKSQILLSSETPTFVKVIAQVQREETRRRFMNDSGVNQTENQAMVVKHHNPRSVVTEWCNHCKRSGHLRERCWVLFPHLRPKRMGEKRRGFPGSRENQEKKVFLSDSNGSGAGTSGFDSITTKNPHEAQLSQAHFEQLLAQMQNFMEKKGQNNWEEDW